MPCPANGHKREKDGRKMEKKETIEKSEKTVKRRYLLISKCLLNVMFFCGIPVTITIPFTLKWYSQINEYYDKYYWIQTALFFICGIFACLIVYELRKMIRSVEEENSFIKENVVSLRRMGGYSFIIAAVTSIRFYLYVTPGVFVVVLVFVIAGLFSKILGSVFAQAVDYKEDNDLTI